MRRARTVALGSSLLLLVACGGADGDANVQQPAGVTADDGSEPEPADPGGTDAGSSEDGAAATDADAGARDADAVSTAGAAGTFTVDDTTYEVTEVLDCNLGGEQFPGDRGFVGESADGTVRMTVAYFEDEALAGLNGAGLDVDTGHESGLETIWASSYAGGDAVFEISQRPDGADGSAEVGVIGPDQEDGSTTTASWSFTC